MNTNKVTTRSQVRKNAADVGASGSSSLATNSAAANNICKTTVRVSPTRPFPLNNNTLQRSPLPILLPKVQQLKIVQRTVPARGGGRPLIRPPALIIQRPRSPIPFVRPPNLVNQIRGPNILPTIRIARPAAIRLPKLKEIDNQHLQTDVKILVKKTGMATTTGQAEGQSGSGAGTSANSQKNEPELIDLTSPKKSSKIFKKENDPPTCANVPPVAPMERRRSIFTMSEQIQLLWNVEESSCKFCCSLLNPGEGVMLNSCLCIFCKSCLAATIELQNTPSIKCPLNDGSSTGCDGLLEEKEIKALNPEVHQRHLDDGLAQAKGNMNIAECKSPGCDGWAELENDGKNFYCKNFHCSICLKTNCLECLAVHEGFDCDAYQKFLQQAGSAEAALIKMKEGQNGWLQLQTIMENCKGDFENCVEGIFTSVMPFDCPICMTEIDKGQGIVLQDCLHMFCKECIVEMIKHSDDAQVKCPYLDGNLSCKNFLKPREIKALAPSDLYEKHLQLSVKLAENAMINSYHCKTPDCPGWCEVEDGAIFFKCFICKKRNCLKCQSIHTGSCEDYKNKIVQNENDKLSEEALQKMVTSGQAMKCPRCGCFVEKTIGCDWIKCTRCMTELCWATKGPRWGLKGLGDITGGCRCDLKHGKPCTPKCQNCH